MYPSYRPGDSLQFDYFAKSNRECIEENDLVVFFHPYKKSFKMVKRVKRIINNYLFFVEGDNPDPTSSEDSHNFGFIKANNIIAFKKENRCF